MSSKCFVEENVVDACKFVRHNDNDDNSNSNIKDETQEKCKGRSKKKDMRDDDEQVSMASAHAVFLEPNEVKA